MRNFERANLAAIDLLNQRGGRMLSLVDLLDAGTVSLPLAAELAHAAAAGRSFLTAAGPGGVGKTTLMGALLAFLPPGAEIVTVDGPDALDRLAAPGATGALSKRSGDPSPHPGSASAIPPSAEPADRPQCLVVHEIGSGSYFGYLWGPAVAWYVDLGTAPGRSLASNLHAETYPAAVAQLTGRPLGVSPEALGRIDLLAFMAAARGKRRVTAVWRADGRGGHRQAWRFWPDDDAFERLGPADPQADPFRAFLARAQADGVRRIEDLRARALADLFQQAP